ncbi:MAG: hypothetical protein E5W87_19385 [Mesorhizobium sp.]|nr:MAG: hypothetical protein E5W87_19385 [Mesorhizobium sp.]
MAGRGQGSDGQGARLAELASLLRAFVPEAGRAAASHLRAGSSFHGNAEPLYLFVFAQFRTENRFILFLELL